MRHQTLAAPRLLLPAALLFGCAASTGPETGEAIPPAPSLHALSTYEAPIGTLVEVYGTGFPTPREGSLSLRFVGTFEAEDGTSHDVDERFGLTPVDGGTARWESFGPYGVPFGTGDALGRFEGTVSTLLETPEGAVVEDPSPAEVTFEVLPSLRILELQPVTATCGQAVSRAIGGAAYRVRVEALGFDPVRFTYTLAAPGLEGVTPISIRHPGEGRFDSVGERGDFVMPAVPEGMQSYGAVLEVEARDADGRSVRSSFAIGVHRPLEVFYNGNVTVAEVMEPAPVSACIPGGEAGRVVVYSESESETRSRSFEVSWNESWLNTHTVSSSSSRTVGVSETNGIGFATSDGEKFRWDVGGEINGEIGLSKLVKLGMSTNFGVGGETSREVERSQDRETGLSQSETTTDTESVGRSESGSEGGSFSWQVSSTETISRDFGGQVIAGTYGVFYRQTLRLVRRAALVTYNQCGAAAVVGEVDFVDWTWSPDLALGSQCPPLPQSNLPEAECIVPPCSGDPD